MRPPRRETHYTAGHGIIAEPDDKDARCACGDRLHRPAGWQWSSVLAVHVDVITGR